MLNYAALVTLALVTYPLCEYTLAATPAVGPITPAEQQDSLRQDPPRVQIEQPQTDTVKAREDDRRKWIRSLAEETRMIYRGSLDLPPPEPDPPQPTGVLARAVVFPGLGWFHLANQKRGTTQDRVTGGLFFVGAVASAVAFRNAIRKHDPFMAGFTGGVFWLVRGWDIIGSTDEATQRNAAGSGRR